MRLLNNTGRRMGPVLSCLLLTSLSNLRGSKMCSSPRETCHGRLSAHTYTKLHCLHTTLLTLCVDRVSRLPQHGRHGDPAIPFDQGTVGYAHAGCSPSSHCPCQLDLLSALPSTTTKMQAQYAKAASSLETASGTAAAETLQRRKSMRIEPLSEA